MESRSRPDYGRAVRFLRGHVTQDGLADDLGLSRAFVSLVESNKRRPSLETVEQICEWAEVEISTFFALACAQSSDELAGCWAQAMRSALVLPAAGLLDSLRKEADEAEREADEAAEKAARKRTKFGRVW